MTTTDTPQPKCQPVGVSSTGLFGFLCTNQHAVRFEQRVKVVALLGRWAIIEALEETMLPGRQVFLFAGQQARVLRSKIRFYET